MMPNVFLKKMIISGFDKRAVDLDIADAIDFMVDKVSAFKINTIILSAMNAETCLFSRIHATLDVHR